MDRWSAACSAFSAARARCTSRRRPGRCSRSSCCIVGSIGSFERGDERSRASRQRRRPIAEPSKRQRPIESAPKQTHRSPDHRSRDRARQRRSQRARLECRRPRRRHRRRSTVRPRALAFFSSQWFRDWFESHRRRLLRRHQHLRHLRHRRTSAPSTGALRADTAASGTAGTRGTCRHPSRLRLLSRRRKSVRAAPATCRGATAARRSPSSGTARSASRTTRRTSRGWKTARRLSIADGIMLQVDASSCAASTAASSARSRRTASAATTSPKAAPSSPPRSTS